MVWLQPCVRRMPFFWQGGGAIGIDDDDLSVTGSLRNCSFTRNAARSPPPPGKVGSSRGRGGVILVQAGPSDWRIESCNFSANEAEWVRFVPVIGLVVTLCSMAGGPASLVLADGELDGGYWREGQRSGDRISAQVDCEHV